MGVYVFEGREVLVETELKAADRAVPVLGHVDGRDALFFGKHILAGPIFSRNKHNHVRVLLDGA